MKRRETFSFSLCNKIGFSQKTQKKFISFYQSKSSRKTWGSCYFLSKQLQTHWDQVFYFIKLCSHAFSWTKKIQQRLDLKTLGKTRLHSSGFYGKICLYSWTRYFWMKGALLWIALNPLSVLNAKRNLAFFSPFTSFHWNVLLISKGFLDYSIPWRCS